MLFLDDLIDVWQKHVHHCAASNLLLTSVCTSLGAEEAACSFTIGFTFTSFLFMILVFVFSEMHFTLVFVLLQLAKWSHTHLQPSGLGLVSEVPVQLFPPGQVSDTADRWRTAGHLWCHQEARVTEVTVLNAAVNMTFVCFRVLSESGCFLLVLFSSTHRAPQFFQCRGSRLRPGPAPQLDYQLLTGFQSVTLYQVTTHPPAVNLSYQQLYLIPLTDIFHTLFHLYQVLKVLHLV